MTLRRRLLEAVDKPQLLQALQRGGQAAVQAEDGVVDYRSDAQRVEHVHNCAPSVGHAVLAPNFLAEAVHLHEQRREMEAGGGVGGGTLVMARVSWLPRSSVMRSGYLTLRASRRHMVSTLCRPLST